jgi:hypothetical protein
MIAVRWPSFTLIERHAKEAIMFAHIQEGITSNEKASLLARAKFFSPESSKAREIQKWLKSQLDSGISGESSSMLLRPAPTTLHINFKLSFLKPDLVVRSCFQ